MMYERRIENSMLKMMNELHKLRLMREMEEAKAAEEEDLKKQSQFAPAQMVVNTFAGERYENKARPGLRKNKAEQSQFENPAAKEAAEMKGCREPFRGFGRRKTLTSK